MRWARCSNCKEDILHEKASTTLIIRKRSLPHALRGDQEICEKCLELIIKAFPSLIVTRWPMKL